MLQNMRRGQAAVEYVVVLCALVFVLGILWSVVQVAERHADRTQALVTMDCP